MTKLYEALSQFQAECPEPQKDARGVAGGRATFMYASLLSILKTAKPYLAKHKLCIMQKISIDAEGKQVLITKLVHADGGSESSEIVLPATSDPKIFGANLTYFKRYAASSLLGIASTDEDLDAEQPTAPQSQKPANQALIKEIVSLKDKLPPDRVGKFESYLNSLGGISALTEESAAGVISMLKNVVGAGNDNS